MGGVTPVDGQAAAQVMLGFVTCRPGYCLSYVWQAYKSLGARTVHPAPTAMNGWEVSAGKHEGDRNPPAGVPVWFGKKPSSAAGDVVISLGDGRVVATDWPRNGVIGITTIDARQRQISRPYLGWTETILDYPISFGQQSSLAAVEAAPIVKKKEFLVSNITPVVDEQHVGIVAYIDELGWHDIQCTDQGAAVFRGVVKTAIAQTGRQDVIASFSGEEFICMREALTRGPLPTAPVATPSFAKQIADLIAGIQKS